MIPAGYMFKSVVSPPPPWLKKARQVERVCSVSGCCSKDFADFIPFWKHNGYWLFDSPQAMRDLAEQHDIDLTGRVLFYYEVYPNQYDEFERSWTAFQPEPSLPLKVVPPRRATLLGYDVVTYFCGNAAECSPLSCNHLAEELPANADCLFDTFEQAKAALDDGRFEQSEEGPFRILSVYRVEE